MHERIVYAKIELGTFYALILREYA